MIVGQDEKNGVVFHRVTCEEDVELIAEDYMCFNLDRPKEYPALLKLVPRKMGMGFTTQSFAFEDVLRLQDEADWYYNMLHGFTNGVEPNE